MCPIVLDKFSPRAILAVLMGYSSTQKGYIMYDLNSKSFFVNRNVVLQEDIFPFKHMLTSSSIVFPILDLLT